MYRILRDVGTKHFRITQDMMGCLGDEPGKGRDPGELGNNKCGKING